MPMEADDVKLGAKVVFFAGVMVLLLRMLTTMGGAPEGPGARALRRGVDDAASFMLRLDAARRPLLSSVR